MKPELELLEDRVTPTAVCEANPTYQAECAYLDKLIPQSSATLTAVQSGNWSNPATWGGRTPTAQDVVYIPNGDTVTVDNTNATALAVLNNGVLNFATNANTQLTVDTVVSGTDTNSPGSPQGEFDMGTSANPIQAGYSANLDFQRSPNHNTVFANDYESLALGLLSMGTLNLQGTQVTPYIAATSPLTTGTTTIVLASAPTGWNVGDTLLFPGTATSFTYQNSTNGYTMSPSQDEQRQIAAINGNTITLDESLQYDHIPAAGTQFLIADEHRNVTIQTVNLLPPPPPPTPPNTFVGADTTTQGSWQGVYGSQGSDISQGFNTTSNSSTLGSALVNVSGNSNWTWASSTTDPRALQEVGSTSSIASCWYSNTSFTVNVNLTDGREHQLALYFDDWDQSGGGRSEKVQVSDALTGTVLDTETISNFSKGEYLVYYDVSGDLNIQITNLNPDSNAVINGLFLDPVNPNHPTLPAPQQPSPPPNPTALLDQQAHVMQMHNDAASIGYVAFDNLGRTDKSQPLDNGSSATGPGLNQVGRYALHFHRDFYPGLTDNDPPIQVVGCFEMGSPGWGYDNHSSDVDFIDDVAYNNLGAGFATEAGNEIGAFTGDYAIRSYGVSNNPLLGPSSFNNQTSMGVDGEGFWLQSPAVAVTNDVATECQVGFTEWNLGLVEKGLGTAQLYIPWLPNASSYPAYLNKYVSVTLVPLTNFSGNTDSYSLVGFFIFDNDMINLNGHFSTVNDFTASDVENGIRGGYNVNNLTISNSTLIAYPNESTAIQNTYAVNGTGIFGNPAYSRSWNLDNLTVEGFTIGVVPPNLGVINIQGGYYNNATNFWIFPGGQTLNFSADVSFGPASQMDYYLATIDQTNWQGAFILLPTQIFLDGGQEELYFADQEPNAVPFPMARPLTPTPLVGLTSQQIYDLYGLAPEGELAPPSAVSEPWTNGFVGPVETMPAYYAQYGGPQPASQPYTLTYEEILDGVVSYHTYPTTFTLQKGLNTLTVTLNGRQVTFFVVGT